MRSEQFGRAGARRAAGGWLQGQPRRLPLIRLTCVVVLVLLGVFPSAAQERGYLAIDEQGGRHASRFAARPTR